MRQGTAASRAFERTFLRKRLFLIPAKAPETGYIQRRFSASSFWNAHFEQSVTTLISFAPLPSFINLRTSRTSSAPPRLRVRFSGSLRTPARLSVTALISFAPLPPFINMRTSRTSSAALRLRVRFSGNLRTPVSFAYRRMRNSVRYAHSITAFHFFAYFA